VVKPTSRGSDPVEVSWRLEGPATGTSVSVLRAVRGGWREVASAELPASRTTWKRSLRAGRYVALLRALGAGGRASPAKRVGFVV
jgi:hypothetical protein